MPKNRAGVSPGSPRSPIGPRTPCVSSGRLPENGSAEVRSAFSGLTGQQAGLFLRSSDYIGRQDKCAKGFPASSASRPCG
ncbi:hypothetical protein OCAR_5623 [Afipia carboxidovorans OM5]|nr:hypothetical protein OCAR_5623 [Afipia carboxidovorans OM5]